MDVTPPPAPPSAPAPAPTPPPAPASPRAPASAPNSAPPHAPLIRMESPRQGQLVAKGKKRAAPSASARAKPSAKLVRTDKRKKRKTALGPFLGAAIKFHQEDDVELTAAGEGPQTDG